MGKVKRMAVSLPEELMVSFEKSLRKRARSNRSKAVSDILREHLSRLEWQKGGKAVGTITMLYDHHARGIVDALTELQHGFGGHIESSLHVHLDHHNCLEVVVVRGSAKKVEQLANRLGAVRGVKHCKFVGVPVG